jgi:2'-5' RNA ligase
MKKRIYNQTSLFGPLYAYLVVISPPDHIKKEIANIKKEMNAIADIKERNVNSIAHITLTEKLTDDISLTDTVSVLTGNQQSFNVALQGWGYFDHGHSITVYLKVLDPEKIIDMAGSLKSSARTPHISLAKKINRDTFERLQPYLNNLNYSARWACTELTVLRKLMSEKHLGFRESIKIPLQNCK